MNVHGCARRLPACSRPAYVYMVFEVAVMNGIEKRISKRATTIVEFHSLKHLIPPGRHVVLVALHALAIPCLQAVLCNDSFCCR